VTSGALVALSDAWTTSLIGAGSALLGAIVGGGIAGWIALRAEDKRHAHALDLERERDSIEQEREARLTLGNARELRTTLKFLDASTTASIRMGLWWPEDTAPALPSREDTLPVISKLNAAEWGSLELALLQARHLMSFRPTDEGVMPDVDDHAREAMEQSWPLFEAGFHALDRLAQVNP
jgi:hypothetical protein